MFNKECIWISISCWKELRECLTNLSGIFKTNCTKILFYLSFLGSTSSWIHTIIYLEYLMKWFGSCLPSLNSEKFMDKIIMVHSILFHTKYLITACSSSCNHISMHEQNALWDAWNVLKLTWIKLFYLVYYSLTMQFRPACIGVHMYIPLFCSGW